MQSVDWESLLKKEVDARQGMEEGVKDVHDKWKDAERDTQALYVKYTACKSKLEDANNSDWEDLASFRLDGENYLLVADIGDNDGKRKDVRLYFVEEPKPGSKKTEVSWKYDYSYPSGPLDA